MILALSGPDPLLILLVVASPVVLVLWLTGLFLTFRFVKAADPRWFLVLAHVLFAALYVGLYFSVRAEKHLQYFE